jgi:hypothetical protein
VSELLERAVIARPADAATQAATLPHNRTLMAEIARHDRSEASALATVNSVWLGDDPRLMKRINTRLSDVSDERV